jgi:hypothetical protein
MNARALVLLVVVLFVACSGKSGGSTTTPTDPTSGPGTTTTGAGGVGGGGSEELTGVGVAFDVEPQDAQVAIDDEPRGKAEELERVVTLAPGLHTFVITLAGYKTYRAEFSVTDKVEKFVVKLEKQ